MWHFYQQNLPVCKLFESDVSASNEKARFVNRIELNRIEQIGNLELFTRLMGRWVQKAIKCDIISSEVWYDCRKRRKKAKKNKIQFS